MITRSNLHTHTHFCDGSNTPQEMVVAAQAAGFRSLGFSGHAFMGPVGQPWCMTTQAQAAYFETLAQLKQSWAGQIDLFVGLELDAFGPGLPAGCDYAIGSCHFFETPAGPVALDHSAAVLRQGIQALSGDAFLMLQRYFDALVAFATREDFAIVGHFDLPMKFNRQGDFFDPACPRYHALALQALDALIDLGKIFEVNTGAMARGHTLVPYPARFLLEHLLRRGAPILLSSDAHLAADLAFAFDATEGLLQGLGFTTQFELTPQGFVERALGPG